MINSRLKHWPYHVVAGFILESGHTADDCSDATNNDQKDDNDNDAAA